MVPDRMTLHDEMEPFDLKLWCVLLIFARGREYCNPTDAALAVRMKASPQTVRRSLLRLEQAKFITRTMEGRTRIIALKPEGDGQAVAEYALRVVAG